MIEKLILNELLQASKKYGSSFASAHEGESVIREEIKEAKEEYNHLKLEFNDVWAAVRGRDTEKQLAGVVKVRARAKNAIEELIQVCAMCDKFTMSFGNTAPAEVQGENDIERKIAEFLLREIISFMNDTCVLCGDYVPEGRIVCPSCEKDPFHGLKKKGGAV